MLNDLKKLILTYHEPKCTIDYGYMKVYWVYDSDRLVDVVFGSNVNLPIVFKF